MLPKIVVMDLGGTIFNNISINFKLGLEYLYENYCLHNVQLNCLLEDAMLIDKLIYQKRDNDDFEINFHNYLNYINKTIGFKEQYDYNMLEKEFTDNACVDELIKDVIELLEFFHSKQIDVYILSNSCFTSNTLKYQLCKKNIDKYFKDVYSSADYLMRKPNQLFFNIAFKYLKRCYPNLSNQDIWYIGNDYKYDMEGAHPFKVKTIWLNQNNEIIKNKVVDYEIKNYQELITILKKEDNDETI